MKTKNKTSRAVSWGLVGLLGLVGGGCGTNPNVIPLKNEIIPREPIKLVTCNYWKDLEPYNNKTNYPEEFFGIKNKFRKDEKMELVLRLPIYGIAGKKLDLVIYNPKDEVVFARSSKIAHNNITFRYGSGSDLTNYLLEKGGSGEYKVLASFRDLVFSHEFELTE